MGRTPDAFDGPSYEEAVVWEEQTSDPTDALRQQYVQGKGLVIMEDGIVHGVGEGRGNVWQPPADDVNVNDPPGSLTVGDRVIVGNTPTGAFVTHEGEIAQWNGSAWVFTIPKQGTVVYVKSKANAYKQTAATPTWAWEVLSTGEGDTEVVAFSAYDSTGGTSITSGWTDVALDVERKKTSDFTHLASSAEVTIGKDTTYLVSATVAIAQSSVGSRSQAQMKVQIDTGSGFVDIPGTTLAIYSRLVAQGDGAATKVFILDLEDGDVLKMQARRESGAGGLVLLAGSELSITTTTGGGGDDVDEILVNNGGDFLANSGGNILKKG